MDNNISVGLIAAIGTGAVTLLIGVGTALIKFFAAEPVKKINNLSETVKIFSDRTNSTIETMSTKVDNVVEAVNTFSFEITGHSNFMRQLVCVYNSYSDLHKYDAAMTQFAAMKNENFDVFALRIDSLQFDGVRFSTVEEIAIQHAESIRKKGYFVIGQSFVDGFYDYHSQDVMRYLDDIKNCMKIEDRQIKATRFREISVDFKSDFNIKLARYYNLNSHLIERAENED